MIIRQSNGKRRAATAVETGLVLIPVTMLVFGLFEYGWLLLNWNVLKNAAREGCRYALANNTDPTLSTDVSNIVTSFMAGKAGDFNSFSVTVSGVHAGTTYTGNAVNNLVAGDLITVTVSGQYRYLNIISLINNSATVGISSGVTMVCEGAM